jgi:hypothetical protein
MTPLAGPLEGGTEITLSGPGLDRLLTRNNRATIPSGFSSGLAPASDGSDLVSLQCRFLHCPTPTSPTSQCVALAMTPVVSVFCCSPWNLLASPRLDLVDNLGKLDA